MNVTAFDLAQRYVGQVYERAGDQDHPFVRWCFSLCEGFGLDTHDEVPWCSAFLQHPFWELGLPRSKSAAARSWLTVGRPIALAEARARFDVVVLSRGANPAQGHVGLFAGLEGALVYLLGGNQSNAVSIQSFATDRVVGVRRLHEEAA